jgi:hypothetical protein
LYKTQPEVETASAHSRHASSAGIHAMLNALPERGTGQFARLVVAALDGRVT